MRTYEFKPESTVYHRYAERTSHQELDAFLAASSLGNDLLSRPARLNMPVTMSTPRASRAGAPAPSSYRAPAPAPPAAPGSSASPSPFKSGIPRGKPAAPVAFATYEIGRSSMPHNAVQTAAFRDGTRRGLIYASMGGIARVESGDPGAYDPFTGDSVSARVSFSHNKMNRPFGSMSARELKLNIRGRGVPGPGSYRAGDAKKNLMAEVDDNRSVFKSGSDQRPPPDSAHTPGPNVYSPNTAAVYPNLRDSGASMRSVSSRFRRMDHPDSTCSQSMTEETVGPGTYESHEHSTISLASARSLVRSSKLRPAFGTVCPQRELPYEKSITPGPGSYQPEIWTGAPSSRRSRSTGTPRRSTGTPRARSAGPTSSRFAPNASAAPVADELEPTE